MANEPLKSAVVTDVGLAKLDAAYQAGEKVIIREIALGDSNFEYVEPNTAFTQLVNEFGRQDINEGNTTDRWIHALVYVDSTRFAGESVWEFGLYDDEGDMIIYSSYVPSLVPDIGQDYIQLEIECSVDLYNASAVTLEVTPIYPQATERERGIAKIATVEDVTTGTDDEKILTVKKLMHSLGVPNVIDKLVTNLWLKLAAKIFPVGAAIPWFTNEAPDGFGIMKGQAFDVKTYVQLASIWPNGIIPDMRGCGVIGKEDGETVGAWEEGQVKAHGHPGSSVGSTNLGTKNSNTTGSHAHPYTVRTMSGALYGGSYNAGFSNPSGSYTNTTASAGNHYHSTSIGAHAHSLFIALFGASRNTINHRKVNWIVRLA
ncbi:MULTISPECIES: phage tail-collar fiber domain-containing protein [unclassified Vibrio]|uniref:phage tail-collar fiber domain-containing protein n=1 Tax=unclassified Vibrio TaxID=2614977 RepID=UPI001360D9DB|nr:MULTISPECIES: phage tail protein [unclassified Vibrio]NAW59645.1 phage tail protein [Vibrio sp. V36_P2S2PM302]NAX23721.1 phage tail protein [Vibrio sp. V39_P1S14PM300]NAX25015.1 phage tail protein [Vibrio sp. V38_P2S17PM301]NAX28601.1 phage tail protein [Vibrio sp. V37_P2S8PM304]